MINWEQRIIIKKTTHINLYKYDGINLANKFEVVKKWKKMEKNG